MNFKLFRISIIGCFFISLLSCNTNVKKYEDYDENDFYEVQGIITKTVPSSNSFDSPRNKTIFYDYHLDMGVPLKGSEENIDLILKAGDPIMVLVHKENIEISFYGGFGIIDDRLKMETSN